MWQDFVLSACGTGFIVALLPTLLGARKPARLTCLLTGILLILMGTTYATLDLWFACVVSLATAGVWFTIMLQGRA